MNEFKSHNKFSFQTTKETKIPNRDIIDIKLVSNKPPKYGVKLKTSPDILFMGDREECIEFRNQYV